MAARTKQWALCALLVCTSSSVWYGYRRYTERSEPAVSLKVSPSERKVLQHVRENGGEVGFLIGSSCETCVRGVFADRDYAAEERIATMPFSIAIWLNHSSSAGYANADEHAYQLIKTMHTDPDFNATHQAWWDTQPTLDDIWAPETFDDDQLDALQSGWMKEYLISSRASALERFHGKAPGYLPLNDVIAPHSISEDTFLRFIGIVATRDFGFVVGGNPYQTFLIEALDMINNAEHHLANSERDGNDTHAWLDALKPIKRGEELTMAYSPGVIHRPDISLIIYGFVQRHTPPQLAAQDLSGFDPRHPWNETPFDSDDDVPEGREEMRQELERCKAILEGLPTTQQEDEAELQAVPPTQWQRRAVLEFRAERKRALAHRIQLLANSMAEL